jgi:hypothetical protein
VSSSGAKLENDCRAEAWGSNTPKCALALALSSVGADGWCSSERPERWDWECAAEGIVDEGIPLVRISAR